MRVRRRLAARLLLAAAGAALSLTAAGAGLAQTPTDRPAPPPGAAAVAVTEVSGAITPVIVEHLTDTLEQAAAAGHQALVIELNTPGGLVTSMQEIVQQLLGAPLPVIVYVTPAGAEAASAGTFVTMAAHVAAMAPATTIGAATPVNLQDGTSREVGDKVVNNAAAYARTIAQQRGRDEGFAVDAVREGRAVTAAEAVEIGAVDLVADDLGGLLERIDGRSVSVRGQQVVLETAGARTVSVEMSLARRLQQALADPNLAFLFMSLGTLGIIYEIANPGMGAGGILGAVMLILAMFSLSVLPINVAGLALLGLAAALFLIEVFVPGIGVAAAGGSVALVLGGLLLVEESSGLGLDWWVVVPSGLVLFGLVVLAGRLVTRTQTAPSRAASDVLIGRRGSVADVDGSRGRIRLDGTWWRARHHAGEPLSEDEAVVVVDRDNLELLVEPADEPPAGDGEPSRP